MGLFRRSRPRDQGSTEPDEHLPFLTVDEASELRRVAQQAFAEAGVDVVIHPGHLQATDGRVLGLWNLAAACRQAPQGRKDWPRMARQHVRALIAPTSDPASLSREELLSRVYLRVYGLSTVPAVTLDRVRYARPLSEDMIEALVLDSPESVTMLLDDVVERHDLDELRQAGLENLLREPIDEIARMDIPGASVHVVSGASVYTGSRVLILPELLRRVLGEREYPDGVLVAVPFRHQILLHPLDGPDVVQSLSAMAQLAAMGFSDSPGSVSPCVYWWREGGLTPVSRPDESGGVAVEVRPELAAVLERLVRAAHG